MEVSNEELIETITQISHLFSEKKSSDVQTFILGKTIKSLAKQLANQHKPKP